jgi:hypothetical protein
MSTLSDLARSSRVNVDAAAPAAAAQEPAPAKPAQFPSPQFPSPLSDVPGWGWKLFIAVWVAFFAIFLFGFGGHMDVLFNLGVVFVFGAMFFGVPIVMIRTALAHKKAPEDGEHQARFDTVFQMVLVPAVLAIGVAAIAMIAAHSAQ